MLAPMLSFHKASWVPAALDACAESKSNFHSFSCPITWPCPKPPSMSNDPWEQHPPDDAPYQPSFPYTELVSSSVPQPMSIEAQAQVQHNYLAYSPQAYAPRSTLAVSQPQQPLYPFGAYEPDFATYISHIDALQYRAAASGYLPGHETVPAAQPYGSSSHQGHHSSMSSLTDEPAAACDTESLPAEPMKDLRCYDHGCNGRAFSTHSNLLRHQREKSGKSLKYTCPNCQAQFTRNTAMKAHMDDNKCGKKRGSSSGHSQQSRPQQQQQLPQ